MSKMSLEHVMDEAEAFFDAEAAVARLVPIYAEGCELLGEHFELFAAGESLDYAVLSSTDDRLDFNVTRCRYKQLMEELAALDLGPYLICDHDFAPALRAGMKLTRTQTCMQGASHCDFRYTKR